MRDDFYGPAWADNHHHVTATLHKLFRSIGVAMERLNAYQFDAPWRDAGKRSAR